MAVSSIRESSIRPPSNSGSGSSPVSGGSTGLDFAENLAGEQEMSGILEPKNGGTGTSNPRGYLRGEGDDGYTTHEKIPSTDIQGPIDCGTFN